MSEIDDCKDKCSTRTMEEMLTFPIEFTFKIVGEYSMKFCTHVERIFDFHPEAVINTTMSSGGKYLSYSVTIIVKDYAEMQDIYQQIDEVPGKKFHV